MRVALTGGVGSGKSTAAAMFGEHGAIVIDADAIAREVVAKGTPGLADVVAIFGPDVLTADGELDRPAMAAVVFTDDEKLAALNSVVHPLVGARVADLAASAGPDDVVVYDVPLLVESNPTGEGFDLVVVVQASLRTRLDRLAGRGMAEQDARDRMARQASDDQRRAAADVLIDNDGTLEELRAAVDDAWTRVAPAR